MWPACQRNWVSFIFLELKCEWKEKEKQTNFKLGVEVAGEQVVTAGTFYTAAAAL